MRSLVFPLFSVLVRGSHTHTHTHIQHTTHTHNTHKNSRLYCIYIYIYMYIYILYLIHAFIFAATRGTVGGGEGGGERHYEGEGHLALKMEGLVEDYRLPWPFRMLIAGSSGSGKTTLLNRFIANTEETMARNPRVVLIFYAHMQETYGKIKDSAPCPVVFIKGGPPDDLKTKPGTLVVVDDLQSSHSEEMVAWFTKKAHHMDTSVIYLVQNVFDRTPSHRTISLNATHIVLFKNPRDSSQVTHLDKQVFPGSDGFLTKAYRAVTGDKPHTYIVIDFNQSTPEYFRLRNTLFPLSDFPNSYAIVKV